MVFGKQKDLSSWFDTASAHLSLQKKVVVGDSGWGLCPSHSQLLINETLKLLSLLPILMQESFWW